MNLSIPYLRKNSFWLLVSLLLFSCEPSQENSSECSPSIKQGITGNIEKNQLDSTTTLFISNADYVIPRLNTFEKTLDYIRKVDNSMVFPMKPDAKGCFEKFLTEGNYKITLHSNNMKYRVLPDSIIRVSKDSISTIIIEVY